MNGTTEVSSEDDDIATPTQSHPGSPALTEESIKHSQLDSTTLTVKHGIERNPVALGDEVYQDSSIGSATSEPDEDRSKKDGFLSPGVHQLDENTPLLGLKTTGVIRKRSVGKRVEEWVRGVGKSAREVKITTEGVRQGSKIAAESVPAVILGLVTLLDRRFEY